MFVLAVQKVLSGSGRAGRLRLMGKYIGHRLVARSELDNIFSTDSTVANSDSASFSAVGLHREHRRERRDNFFPRCALIRGSQASRNADWRVT